MTHPALQPAAEALARARDSRTPCGRISERFDINSLADAYAVQELNTQAAPVSYTHLTLPTKRIV